LAVLLLRRKQKKKEAEEDDDVEVSMNDLEKLERDIPIITDITIGKQLGAGNFGEVRNLRHSTRSYSKQVYMGTAWETTSVALKRLKGELLDEFIAEASVLW
jgi:hypothetical protein